MRLATGVGLVADAGAVVLLWQEGITTVAAVLCLAGIVASLDLLVRRPRSRRAHALLAVAVLAPVLVLTGLLDHVKQMAVRGDSLSNMDGGTWIHVHPHDGDGFTKCTTAFAVESGSARYVVTARACLPDGPATITTSDDPTGERDRHTFATGVDCTRQERCRTADTSSTTQDGAYLAAAFEPDTATPSFEVQADAETKTVPVIGSVSVDDVRRHGDLPVCHYGLGSSEHGSRQPKQCGRLIGTAPRGTVVDGTDASGLVELDVYGHSDGDLGGPVYVFAPDGRGVYIVGMVVSSSGSCDLTGCHGKVLVLPVQAIEQALGARLLTSS